MLNLENTKSIYEIINDRVNIFPIFLLTIHIQLKSKKLLKILKDKNPSNEDANVFDPYLIILLNYSLFMNI